MLSNVAGINLENMNIFNRLVLIETIKKIFEKFFLENIIYSQMIKVTIHRDRLVS
jgi:hypothetical protein